MTYQVTCDECEHNTFTVTYGGVNGGVLIIATCTACGHTEELIDTYGDNDY